MAFEKEAIMAYEAPTVVRYGTVTGLTSSILKCSPGTDTGLGKSYEEVSEAGFLTQLNSADTGGGHPNKIDKDAIPTVCQPGDLFFD